ncbi:hypothetical protein [Streptomyces microflavus]|uniref:hypothetical protein n=1 Tax=Streptomyces microflavus TaxID=1919 RepID=UPI003B2183A0
MSRDTDRLVWLFGKPYYWARTAGQLRLHSAPWALPDPEPIPFSDITASAADIAQAVFRDVQRMRARAGRDY